jgi:lipopolysaccharide transport system permease protein
VSNMQSFSTSPQDIIRSLVRSWGLLWTLVQRELASRYKGSALGIVWSFLIPLAMLAIYTVVFSGVFKSRWGGEASESQAEFALILFAGLAVFNFFAECVNRAPGVIVSNPNLVKKVVFPLEILAWVTIASALFNTFVSLIILLLVQAFLDSSLPWTCILFPLIMLPLVLISLGLVWFLSSLSVFIRDIGQVTGLVTTGLLFLSAVFFPASALPDRYRWLVFLNPVAISVEWGRGVLIFGRIPSVDGLAIMTALGIVVAYFGFIWFQKTRKGFADVL